MPHKIVTDYWAKPIPQRCYDWTAFYEGTEERGWYGYGSTEEKAIADLIENCPQPNKG